MKAGFLTARGKAVAATHSPEASRAALKVLEMGGNAVDAAIAASLVIGVSEPGWSGVGGGGFALIYDGSKAYALDYREVAPMAARPELYGGEEELGEGPKAVAVPGTLRGLMELHEKLGALRWEALLRMAWERAESWRTTRLWSTCMRAGLHNALRKLTLSRESRETWLKQGSPPQEGEPLPQRRLAKTLQKVSEEGVEEFYSGGLAESLAREVSGAGGLLTPEDLERYKPVWRRPIEVEIELGAMEVKAYAMPPPGSGAIVLEALWVLSRALGRLGGVRPGGYVVLLARVLRQAVEDRGLRVCDPSYGEARVEEVLTERYVEKAAERVLEGFQAGGGRGAPSEWGTSQITVADAEGVWVSLTESLECFMGSGVTAEGVILNDEMHDFDLDESSLNSIEPGKRPASSMSPIILLDRGGEPLAASGASGGLRIITSIVQVLADIFLLGRGYAESVVRGRIHPRGGEFLYEESVEPELLASLRRAGFNPKPMRLLQLHPGTDIYFGAVQSVFRVGGELLALSDPRKQAAALAAK